MRLELQESGVEIQPEKFACDKSLRNSNKIPSCLPKQSFSMAIVAPPASGKTTLLINLLCRWYECMTKATTVCIFSCLNRAVSLLRIRN